MILLAIRFALRELRGGLRGFGIFIAAIALGVAAIAGVGSVARGMTAGIAEQGRAILGGDIAFSLAQRQAGPAERAWLAGQGTVAEIATLRGMARLPGGADQSLVEIKAVDAAYPLYGAVEVAGGGDFRSLLQPVDGADGGLAEPELFTRLGLKVGDRIEVGHATIVLRGVIAAEPDRVGGGFSFGPRLMLTRAALERAGLVQPGSLVTWRYLVRLDGTPSDDDVRGLAARAASEVPGAAWQVRTRDDAAPGLRNNIERFAEFLTLIGLTALIVGGVGVANAVGGFLDDKRPAIATLKSLGATADTAIAVYLAEILLIAAGGVAIGLAVGAAVPFAAGAALRSLVPVAIGGLYPGELLLAALFGFLTVIAFALPALGRARQTQPASLFRDQAAPLRPTSLPRGYRAAIGIAGLLLVLLAVALAFDRTVALVFLVAAIGAFLLLRLVAAAIVFLARRTPRPNSTTVRLAVANIHRPGALTGSVVLSLGLGVTLLVALVQIDGNFRRELFDAIPKDAPSFFFLDIQGSQTDAFRRLIAQQAPGAKLEMQPMLRGRIVSLNGVGASKAKVDDDMRWVLEGDRGITYAAALPQADKITAGSAWTADYDGPVLVSFDERVAEGLHLHPGDTVTVNVIGREVTARVANLREVEWRTLSVNSIMVFSPNAFRGAPFASLATLAWPDGGTPDEENRVLRAVTAEFPAATAIRVKEAVARVNDLVGQIALAVRAASGVALLSALLVLGGAFAAGRRRRLHDAVVLKVLGATRTTLALALALEFLLLAAATAVFAIVAGTLAAWLVSARIMELDFTFLAAPALIVALAAVATTLLLGLAGTWRVLGQRAAPVLRNL